MKLLLPITALCLAAFSTISSAQEVAQYNPVEKSFIKHMNKILPQITEAIGAPADQTEKVKSEILKGLTKSGAMKLTDEEKKIIETNGKAPGYKKAHEYWSAIHKKMPDPKLVKSKRDALPAVVAAYFSKFKANAPVADQFLLVKSAKTLREQLEFRTNAKNISYAKVIFINLLEIANNKGNINAYKQPERLRFLDDNGKRHDWIIKAHETEDEQPRIISPMLSGGKYIICLVNGATLRVSPADAKEKYGIGK